MNSIRLLTPDWQSKPQLRWANLSKPLLFISQLRYHGEPLTELQFKCHTSPYMPCCCNFKGFPSSLNLMARLHRSLKPIWYFIYSLPHLWVCCPTLQYIVRWDVGYTGYLKNKQCMSPIVDIFTHMNSIREINNIMIRLWSSVELVLLAWRQFEINLHREKYYL